MPMREMTRREAWCQGKVVAVTAEMPGCARAQSTQAAVASVAKPCRHAVPGAAVEDHAADHAGLCLPGDHQPVAPEALLRIATDGREVRGEGPLDQRAPGPRRRQPRPGEPLGGAAIPREDRLDHGKRDRNQLEPPCGDHHRTLVTSENLYLRVRPRSLDASFS
jgi:hypothetical protein